MTSTRAALEAALVANPDDLALHSAYADLLMEEGDSRGEFIRDCLAKEQKLRVEKTGFARGDLWIYPGQANAANWLGPLARFDDEWSPFVDELNVRVAWMRGWLDHLSVDLLRPDVVQALVSNPITRLLWEFSVRHCSKTLTLSGDWPALLEHFRHTSLSELECGGMRHGDEFVQVLIDSDLIPRLKVLGLRGCSITDRGAELLAQALGIGNLTRLGLHGNRITAAGLAALKATGLRQFAEPDWESEWDMEQLAPDDPDEWDEWQENL